MRSKSMILILVSLGFGAIAAVGMFQVISHNAALPSEERIPVLVAIEDLNIKDELTSENVQLELYPASLVPDGVITSWEEAEGKRVMARVSRGMPIMGDMILDKHTLTDVEVPPGYKVIAIRVDARDSFHGLLKPGHRVDVIAIFNNRDADEAKTFLKNVLVYAVDNKTDRIPTEGDARDAASTVQLIVNQRQAEAIALYEDSGRMRLVMGSETTGNEPELVDDAGMFNKAPHREVEETPESWVASLLGGVAGLLDTPTAVATPTPPATPPTPPSNPVRPADVNRTPSPPPAPQHTMMVMLTNGAVVNYQWSDRGQLPTLQPTMQNYGTPALPASGPASPYPQGPIVPPAGSSFDYVDDGAE